MEFFSLTARPEFMRQQHLLLELGVFVLCSVGPFHPGNTSNSNKLPTRIFQINNISHVSTVQHSAGETLDAVIHVDVARRKASAQTDPQFSTHNSMDNAA